MDKEEMNKIIEKTRMKIAVSNFKNQKEEAKKTNWQKIVASLIVCLGITSGLVYATGSVVEKIWNTPKESIFSHNISEEEKENYISEEEAIKKGNEYLKYIGLEDSTVKNLVLMKDSRTYTSEWFMNAGMGNITINAENGDLVSAQFPSYFYKIPYDYAITVEEARKIAYELLEKYKPKGDNSEYELVELKANGTPDWAYIWYATFYKKYGDLTSKYESISLGWVPTVNGLYSLNIKKDKYENNEEKITKEQAILIAKEKDKQIENNEIADAKAEIRIRQMNDDLYRREKDPQKYYKEHTWKSEGDIVYETSGNVRKVWCVVLTYKNNKNLMFYTYYVDATTGEIIGGSNHDEFFSEEILKNDEYNMIEK